MYHSPLAVDQRRCPSFLSDPQPPLTRSLSAKNKTQTKTISPGRTHREFYTEMLQRDGTARERREAARAEQHRRELLQCRAAPRISAGAQQLQRNSDIVDRLMRLHDERRRLDEYRQREAQTEQQQNGWFAPVITDRGSRAEGRALSLAQRPIELCREEERERERGQLAAAAAQHCRQHKTSSTELYGTPTINAHSGEIVRRVRHRDGLQDLTYVGAMLERDRIAQLARWEQHQQHHQSQQDTSFSPRITAYAAALQRDGNTTKRLMAYARRRSERPQKSRNASPHNSSAGGRRKGHTPTIDSVSAMIAAGLPESSNERLMAGFKGRNTISNNKNKNSNSINNNSNSSSHNNSNSGNHTGDVNMAEDLGVEEYVASIHTPRRGRPNVSSPRRNSNVYERMWRWQKLRDERVRQLRDRLQEEYEEQEGVKNEVNTQKSPEPHQAKFLTAVTNYRKRRRKDSSCAFVAEKSDEHIVVVTTVTHLIQRSKQ
ncbi:hypothetical protein LSM04_009532 [Trypanosoma melophagium]|uniref:uncharacterized protein n=1 Tax=Trypanosoma melophagium TaxID=715481 RepID=UPI00351A3F0C|nr:hypothetical protein LSM04_009532 [Trypanosoma melophagium]